jgi:thiol-disulfide isomerase/thioredoxin
VREHQNELKAKYPGSYVARLVAAFQEPEIPEAPLLPDGTPDKSFPFRYYRSHYWDGFDVADEVWINTPYLKDKIDRYLDKLTVQHPDSVISAVDVIMDRAVKSENNFKYILPYLLNKYYKPEIMGLDKAYVHLAEKYYKSGIADWVTEEQLKKITDDAFMINNVLLGNPAPNVKVQLYDPAKHEFTTELISPYDVEAEFTVVFLWKPGCGHCKKMTEELKPFYEKWKDKGVEIFSITSANHMDLEKALKDIKEKDMPWIITADPYQRARAMQNFYGTSLPKLYILNKDKKIMANRVGAQQLEQIIEDFRQKDAVNK